MLDLVRPLQRVVDPLAKLGPGIGGIKALVGIYGVGDIGVGRNLPPGQVDRLQSSPNHLNRLIACHGAERTHAVLGSQGFPEPISAPISEGVGDSYRSAKPFDISRGVIPDDALEAGGRRAGNEIFEFLGLSGHCRGPPLWRS